MEDDASKDYRDIIYKRPIPCEGCGTYGKRRTKYDPVEYGIY